MIIVVLCLGAVLVGVLVWALSNLVSVLGGVQLVTTPATAYSAITTLAGLTAGQQFIDLGSGLGNLAAFVATQSPQATVRGIELSPLWVLVSRIKHRGPNVSFLLGNLATANIRSADVVYCYPIPSLLPTLERVCSQLKPGARIILYAFPFERRTPTKTVEHARGHARIFLYEIPAATKQ